MAKQAVALKEETQLTLPSFMQEQVGLGTENLGTGDVAVPRIKLMQALSPELEEFDELRAGMFWHSLAEQNFGSEVRISPIFVDKSFILWRPRKSGGGILARAIDGQHWSPSHGEFAVKLDSGKEVTWKTAPTVEGSGLAAWGSSDPADTNSPPAATRMFNVVATFPDSPDLPPAVITLQRASIKVAQKFVGKLKITRAPSFGLIFKMSSFKDKNSAGQEFFNFAFKSDGLVEDKAQYDVNFDYYKYFKAQGVTVKDLESAQDDEGSTDTGKGGNF